MYTDIEGNQKVMGSTQFEALDARRAFPCFDEPARKAIFGFSMILDRKLQCLSNMPEKSVVTINANKKHVTFMDSPKMSTYLLAWCIGEFDFVQAQTQHGVLVDVYTPPGKSESGRFALDCAVQALDLYNDFFGLHFPLPKVKEKENWNFAVPFC